MNEKWFRLSISDIEKKLKTNAASGLSPKAARSRGNKGAGQLFYLPRKSFWRIFLDIISDFSLVILVLGAVFSLFFETEEHIKGLTVLVIVGAVLVALGILYYRSNRTMESLGSFFYPSAKVIRGGRLFLIDYRSVVVGDVILLEKGDIICADARLVSSNGLRVRMRKSAKEYTLLEKNANGELDPSEIHAHNMSNVVHGGSTVLSGSGRAIVYAVGGYTYLGAMTGGIPLPIPNSHPKLLEEMRKQFSRFNMITLIAVIPFTVISLLLGNMIPGQESSLSVAFLSGLALAATTMPILTSVLLRMYYVHKIRRLVMGRSPAVVKSVEAFDKLAEADYIFMLDGCAVTDGKMHFKACICPEGEIRNYSTFNKTVKLFSEYVALYYSTSTQTLTTGVSGISNYISGIRSFVDMSGADINALKIRCSISTYFTGNMIEKPESIVFTDRGSSYCLKVWRTPKAFQDCKNVMLNGAVMPLSSEGKKNFERLWHNSESSGETPLLFTLSSELGGYSDSCILGIIILKEGVDTELKKHMITLERLGCKVISFSRRERGPKLPPEITGKGCVVKASFIRNKLPLTYNFGSISAYSDLTDDDIVSLIDFAHSQGKRVAAIGFTEGASRIARKADVFATCSDISPQAHGYLNEELNTSEISGQEESASCTQTVKERSDCIIPRSKNGIGGLSSLVAILTSIRSLRKNVSDYLRYITSTQLIRFIVAGIPMFLGNSILDVRHIMLGAFVLDLFVFFAFMIRTGAYPDRRVKDYCSVNSIKDYFLGDRTIILSSIVASITAVILPVVADFIAGGNDYKLEGAFTSLLLLHIVSFILVYYGNNIKDIKHIYKNKLLLIEIAVTILIWLLCFTVAPIGVLFDVQGWMSVLYFVISLVAPVVMVVLFFILNKGTQTKKI